MMFLGVLKIFKRGTVLLPEVEYWGHVAEGPAAPAELAEKRHPPREFWSFEFGEDLFWGRIQGRISFVLGHPGSPVRPLTKA